MESLQVSPRQTLSRDLSKAPSMTVGSLEIDPPLRKVTSPAGAATLEPRVMRTLIVLAEAQGEVLSRDDLIELAWDGVIVGDNAINRVISQLRKVLAELAGNAVRLETITKVGFRLIADYDARPEAPLPARSSTSVSRRGVLVAGALATVAVAGTSAIWLTGKHRPAPEARALWERGQLTQKTAEPGTMETAMGFYKRAIEIDPQYADAWGALAIAYRHALVGFSTKSTEGYDELATSAARRALELDPGQPDADAVSVMFKPRYGRLAAAERDLRALLGRHPDYWYALGQLAIMLRDAGRFAESIKLMERQLSLDPMLPVAWSNLAFARTCTGDLQGSDMAIEEGQRRFSANRALWVGHYQALLLAGRFVEAAAVARDARERPEYIPADLVDFLASLAEALEERSASTIAKWRKTIGDMISENPTEASWLAAAQFQFGLVDDAFASLQKYFRAAGPAQQTPFETETANLFTPPVLAHRQDRRYAALLEETGLLAYWKETGSQPDFRLV